MVTPSPHQKNKNNCCPMSMFEMGAIRCVLSHLKCQVDQLCSEQIKTQVCNDLNRSYSISFWATGYSIRKVPWMTIYYSSFQCRWHCYRSCEAANDLLEWLKIKWAESDAPSCQKPDMFLVYLLKGHLIRLKSRHLPGLLQRFCKDY